MARPIQDSVVLFGDSITSRQEVPGSLHARFAEAYRRTLDVLNRGYGGYNTEKAIPLLDELLYRNDEVTGASRVRLITVWYGTNDAALPGTPANQNVPLPEYTANLHKILETLTSGTIYPTIPNIILITPPPLLKSMMPEPMVNERDFEFTRGYVDAARKVGEEWKAEGEKSGSKFRVGYVDAWTGIIEAAGGSGEELRPYFNDGLHLTSKGYDVVWKGILKILKEDFKGRGVDPDDLAGLPYTFPDWSDIKDKGPDSAVKGMTGPYKRK